MDKEANKCYAYLLQGIRRQAKDVDCGNASVDSIKAAYLAIYNDHPELFYLSSSPQIAQRKSGFAGFGMLSCSSSVVMTPIYSSKEIRDCELKIDDIKATLKKKVTVQTTDEQKVLLAAEYIVRNLFFIDDMASKQSKK